MSAPVCESVSPTAFDVRAYVASLGLNQEALRKSAVYRRAVTKVNPLLFALIYMPHQLRGEDTGGAITLSQFHLDLCDQAKQWIRPLGEPRQYRDCYVAPRNAGKSTWLFLLLPMWAAAHGHVRFIAAFADSLDQAKGRLRDFKMELRGCELLRSDFPELCTPAGPNSAQGGEDTRTDYVAESGFVFKVRGVNSAVLGMKHGELRPELILLDDIEPKESGYSLAQKEDRLTTLIGTIFRLRQTARVVFTGTVTMFGSIVHDLVRTVTEPDPPESWPKEQNFKVHYYPAIVTQDDGSEASWWPEFRSLESLQDERHTADFKMHMMNSPAGSEGAAWVQEDFLYGELEGVTRTILAIDPAVSSNKPDQDFTGLAVIGWSPLSNQCVVRHAEGVKLTGRLLRARVMKLLERFPEIRVVLVEVNQGGELWEDVFHDLPNIDVRTSYASIKKEVRFLKALNHWQRRRVLHETRIPAFEDQALAYPNVMNDDIIDAVVFGVQYLFDLKPPVRPHTRVRSYL